QMADVWSCGVALYAMVFGTYPFGDTKETQDFREEIQRVLNVQYSFPQDINISEECRDLISRIFVRDPAQRITMADIKTHAWFLKNPPVDFPDDKAVCKQDEEPIQSLEVVMQILSEAKTTIPGLSKPDIMDDQDLDIDSDPDLDADSSGEVVYAL
ncbi:hypothetical protein F511_29903, partial [Dorcoceras hygrometricum]